MSPATCNAGRLCKKLLCAFVGKNPGKENGKLEFLPGKGNERRLHLIWIKIPKGRELSKNKVQTIGFNYSSNNAEGRVVCIASVLFRSTYFALSVRANYTPVIG